MAFLKPLVTAGGVTQQIPNADQLDVGNDARINGVVIGRGNTSLSTNTVIGASVAPTMTGPTNTIIGALAGTGLTGGGNNVCIGYDARVGTGTGSTNVVVGARAGTAMTDASRSVCIGYNAVVGSTPSGNVCIGADAGSGLVAGGSNVCIGNFSAVGTTTSGANVVIGASAGTTLTAGTSLTLIGNNTQGVAGVLSNATAIGNGASVSASNSIQLGNTSITLLRCQVALTVVSDARDKADVETLPDALPILADLRPVKYRWDNRSRYDDGVSDGSKKDTAYTTGFIAQEIQQARASHNADWLDAVYDGDPDHLGVTHERLLPLIVKAAQELAAKATAAEARAAAAEARLAALEAAVATLQAG